MNGRTFFVEYAHKVSGANALAGPRPVNQNSKGNMAYIALLPKNRRREARQKKKLTVADEIDALGRENVHDGGTTLAGNYRYVALHPSSSFSLKVPEMSRKVIRR